jgi:hypothetical protein
MLDKLINIFREKFGEKNLNYFFDNFSINEILKICKNERKNILLEDVFNSYHKNNNYMKYLLLEKITRQILKEIKPGRTKINLKSILRKIQNDKQNEKKNKNNK